MTHNNLRVLDHVDTAVLIVELETGMIRYFNRQVCIDLEKAASEIKNRHYRQVFPPEFITIYDRAFDECAHGKGHTIIHYWAEKAQWERILAKNVVWESKPAMLMSITFISEMARSEYQFEYLAYFDNLLNLPNGSKLEDDINELANLETVTLLYFEIPRFEEINDLYGWDSGDYLLMQVRDWLLSSETRRAQLYRVNNGFAILGRNLTLEDSKDRVEEIIRRFDQPWTLSAAGNAISLFCTIKIGIVAGKYVRNEMRNLLVRTIRTSPPNAQGYAVYDEETDKSARRTLRVREMLINCIYDDMKGFAVHYQPFVDVKTKRWVGVEALCRWTTPDGVNVPPGDFIRTAEKLRLIDRIDNWVYRTAMQQCVSLGLHEKEFILNMNFSPIRHVGDEFIEGLMQTLSETGFPPEKLNMEITESAKMHFSDDNLYGLQRLVAKGVSFCLDDFGTGYSNFENLINLSVKAFKTDKVFLDGIEDDEYRQYLLAVLVHLAHKLEMNLVCEGVETGEQLALVARLGVNYVQGYYFSRPLFFEQLEDQARRFKPAVREQNRSYAVDRLLASVHGPK